MDGSLPQRLVRDFLSGRQAVYEYLSLVFKEPPKGIFIGLSGKYIDIFKAISVASNNADLKDGVVLLKRYIALEKKTSNEELLHKLNTRYTSLFLLGFNSVPLNASALLVPGGVAKSGPWEKVLEIYAQWGFKNPPDFNLPEDHLYAELKFMEKLSSLALSLWNSQEYDSFKNVLNAQLTFIKENMDEPLFVFVKLLENQACISKSEHVLYEACSKLAKGYLMADAAMIEHVLTAI